MALFMLILTGVLVQTSVLTIVFPRGQAPNVVLLVIIAWIIAVGFDKIWPWVITAGIIMDLAFFEPLGKNVILLTLASCAVDFFSNRLPTESRAGKIITAFFVSALAAALDSFFNIFFIGPMPFAVKNIAVQIAAGAILFYASYIFLKKRKIA